jgi:Fe-S cluster assembly protein SufB
VTKVVNDRLRPIHEGEAFHGMSTTDTQYLHDVAASEYEHGWATDIETERAPNGLNEDVIRFISERKEEPEWLLEWRLKAYRHFQTLLEDESKYPRWAHLKYVEPNLQSISYYAAPKHTAKYESIDDVPQELLDTFAKLGIPAARAEGARRRGCGCSDGQRFRRYHLQEGAC